MNNLSRIWALSLAAVLAVVGLSLTGCGREAKVEPLMPPLLEHRIEFHPSKTKAKEEKARFVQYSPDGKVMTGIRIEYKTGITSHVKLRTTGAAGGTIESVVIDYPLAPGQKKRQVARELKLDVDGVTAVEDFVYRENGVLRYFGDRKSSDRFESFEFFENSTQAEKHQVYLKSWSRWRLSLEEHFRPDGALSTTGSRREDGSVVAQKFDEGNKLAWRSLVDVWGSDRTIDYYEKDGTTPSKRVNQTTHDVTVSLFKNGHLSEETRFYREFNWITVKLYDDSGKLHLAQSWVPIKYGDLRTDGKFDAAKYRLDELSYTDANGLNCKQVSFYADGKTPDWIRLRDAKDSTGGFYPYTRKNFRPDGTLSEVVYFDSSGGFSKKEEHTAAENIREILDASDLAIPNFEQPPDTLQGQPITDYYH